MNKKWFQIILEHGELMLRENAAGYEEEYLDLRKDRLYFVVEGCVLVRDRIDHHVLYLVRSRGCLNLEVLTGYHYDYEYIRIAQARLLTIPITQMQDLLKRYPKLMPRLLRHEHFVLDQMIQFSLLYRKGCDPIMMRQLYDRLHPPFSYAVFEKYVNDAILTVGDSHDIKSQ